MQYQSTCCHSDNCCKTMPVVLGIKGFNAHFTAENGEFVSHVFRERKTLHRERFAKEMAKGKIE